MLGRNHPAAQNRGVLFYGASPASSSHIVMLPLPESSACVQKRKTDDGQQPVRQDHRPNVFSPTQGTVEPAQRLVEGVVDSLMALTLGEHRCQREYFPRTPSTRPLRALRGPYRPD